VTDMSARRISLEEFADTFSWQTFRNLPADRTAAEFVCGTLSMLNAAAAIGRADDVACMAALIGEKLELERRT
jgi:hypothetical protein